MEIEIGRDKLIISERTAQEVLNLIDYHEKNKSKSDSVTYNLVIMASVAESSLKRTRKNLAWYRFLLKLKYRKYTTKYILDHFSQKEILDIYTKILELEGVDIKKKEVVEVQSAE